MTSIGGSGAALGVGAATSAVSGAALGVGTIAGAVDLRLDTGGITNGVVTVLVLPLVGGVTLVSRPRNIRAMDLALAARLALLTCTDDADVAEFLGMFRSILEQKQK